MIFRYVVKYDQSIICHDWLDILEEFLHASDNFVTVGWRKFWRTIVIWTAILIQNISILLESKPKVDHYSLWGLYKLQTWIVLPVLQIKTKTISCLWFVQNTQRIAIIFWTRLKKEWNCSISSLPNSFSMSEFNIKKTPGA